MTKHQVRREVVCQLINRRGGKLVARVQTAYEARREQHRTVAMNRWIAEISRDRVPPMLCLDAFEVPRHFVECFIPPDVLPTVGRSADRPLQTVFVIVNVL